MGGFNLKKAASSALPAIVAPTLSIATGGYGTLWGKDTLPGGKRDAIFGGMDAAKMRAANEDQRRELEAQLAQRDALEGKANEMFGVGFTPSALANAAQMGQQRTRTASQAFQGVMGQADQGLQSDLTDARIAGARSGQIGGQMDAQRQGNALARYFARLNQAQIAKNNAGGQFDATMLGRRLALTQAIRGGQVTDPADLQAEQAQLAAQGSPGGMWQGIIGNSLAAAGQGAAGMATSAARRS